MMANVEWYFGTKKYVSIYSFYNQAKQKIQPRIHNGRKHNSLPVKIMKASGVISEYI